MSTAEVAGGLPDQIKTGHPLKAVVGGGERIAAADPFIPGVLLVPIPHEIGPDLRHLVNNDYDIAAPYMESRRIVVRHLDEDEYGTGLQIDLPPRSAYKAATMVVRFSEQSGAVHRAEMFRGPRALDSIAKLKRVRYPPEEMLDGISYVDNVLTSARLERQYAAAKTYSALIHKALMHRPAPQLSQSDIVWAAKIRRGPLNR